MAYIAASRVALACLVSICLLVAGAGAEENNNHSLLGFQVSLPDAGGQLEFVCDLGGGYDEASKSIDIDLSELNHLEKVVVSYHNTKGLGEFVCWREKRDISVPSQTIEDLGSQIQGFLTYRLRSLLSNGGESSLAPTAQINSTGKASKENSSVVDPLKNDLGSEAPSPTVGKAPEVNDRSDAHPPPKDIESSPPPHDIELSPPPPPPSSPPPKEDEKEKKSDTANQSAQHHDVDDSKYRVCEKEKNLFARLQIPGDGTQTLTLSLRNDGEGNLDVEINAPGGLSADPSSVNLRKGESAVKVNVAIVDRSLLENEENILISWAEGNCTVLINLNALENPDNQSYFDRFSMPHMPAVVTPEMRLGVLFFILSIIGGLVIWRTWAKWRRTDGAGAGHSYQELEMSLPSNGDNSTSAYGQEKHDKSGSGDEEGWDDGWDDWEDTEAARSSSRLIPSLSAKGLAARRSNKDGWESSWDD